MPATDILLKEPIPWVPGLEGSYPGEESNVELGETRVRMLFCWCLARVQKGWLWDKPVPGFWLAKKAPGIVRGSEAGLAEWDPRVSKEAQGLVLKELHDFLRQTLGNVPLAQAPRLGLCRVWDRTRGRYSWVHPRFAKDY